MLFVTEVVGDRRLEVCTVADVVIDAYTVADVGLDAYTVTDAVQDALWQIVSGLGLPI